MRKNLTMRNSVSISVVWPNAKAKIAKQIYVRKPVLRPKTPQNCWDIGASAKAIGIKSAAKNIVKTRNSNLPSGLRRFLGEDSTIPKSAKAKVLRIKILIGFIGSKLDIGETAIVTADAPYTAKERTLLSRLLITG